MRLSVIITLTLLFGCMMAAEQDQEASYKIDDALDALIDLREDTANSLYELEEVWRMSKEALQGEERALIELISTREAQCKVDLENRDKTEKDLKDTNDYIEWLEKQIKDSSENLEELLIRRCELNKQFIDHIKREKIAMSLLEFIRIAVERKETFDFLQMKKFNKSFTGFLQAYHNNDMNTLMLLQQDLVDGSQYNVDVDFSTHDRTEEETGTGHVDNEKGNISLDDFTNGRRKNWSIYKQELLDILVELKAKISQKIKAAIDDEIAASVALANYKNNVLRNIEKYEKELVKARKQAIDLQDQLNDDNATLQKCQSDHAELQIQLQQIQNEIAHKQSEFDIKHHDLGEQVAIFDEIIAEYRNSVFSENNEFKDRTEDYFDNETFDNDDSYTNREIPDIDFINGGF